MDSTKEKYLSAIREALVNGEFKDQRVNEAVGIYNRMIIEYHNALKERDFANFYFLSQGMFYCAYNTFEKINYVRNTNTNTQHGVTNEEFSLQRLVQVIQNKYNAFASLNNDIKEHLGLDYNIPVDFIMDNESSINKVCFEK